MVINSAVSQILGAIGFSMRSCRMQDSQIVSSHLRHHYDQAGHYQPATNVILPVFMKCVCAFIENVTRVPWRNMALASKVIPIISIASGMKSFNLNLICRSRVRQ